MSRNIFYSLLLFVKVSQVIKGQVNLTVPVAGNCGDDTILTCQYTAASCSSWSFIKNGSVVSNNINPVVGKNEGSVNSGLKTITLTIKNMEMADAGGYKCICEFDTSSEGNILFECKPKTVTKRIEEDKKLEISFNKVYPNPSSVSVTVDSMSLTGTHTCTGTPSTSYSCTWTSSSSLEDVNGGYRVVVTTVTETQLTDSIKIATPGPPSITNREQLPDNRLVIRATEGSQVTLTCVSSGGIPAPTVVWYKDRTSTSPLKSTSTEVLQGDGTYTVTLTHTMQASRSDDLRTFVCRSHYPQATSTVTRGSRETTVVMYLNLKPSKPTITQTNIPVSTGTMTLQCTTSGCRPSPTVTWTYRGQTYSPQVQSDMDPTTETYRVVSTFQRPVTVADNGQQATCHVNHVALTAARTNNIDVNVKFPVSPGSTTIYGNSQIIATGSNPLNLNCTTGSSNPASTIIWRRGSTVITNSNSVHSWAGTNRGKVTSQILRLTPTRDDDGDVITCSVTNSDSDVATSQGGAVTKSVTLNLTYSPQIQPMTRITVDEGREGIVLPCIVSSKPVSTIMWYHSGSSLGQGQQGTPTSDGFNSYNYTLTTVSRDDQGTYTCQANNKIGSTDNKNMEVIVRYVTVSAINTTTDSSSTTVTCTLNNIGGSYDSRPWVQKWLQSNGTYVEVNNRPFSTTLDLTQLTYQHSGVYICMVKAKESDAIFVQGNTSLHVKAPPVLLKPEGNQDRYKVSGRLHNNSTVSLQYYSNVPGSEVKCFRSNNGTRSSTPVGYITQSEMTVQLPVFAHTVPTLGTNATVFIMIKTRDDFGDYDITITNGIGSGTKLLISVIAKGPPDAPTSIQIVIFSSDSATLEWVPGYHGGLDQTFVIQLSTDKAHWFNKTSVNGGQNSSRVSETLNDLQPSTMYYARMFAYNSEGRSGLSGVFNFTTTEETSPPGSPAAVIGGVAGGAAAVIIIAVVVAVVLIRRRKQSKADNTELMDRRRDSDSDNYITENAQYASADQMESPASGSATYAAVDKTKKKKGADPSVLYAVPDKPKKGQKPDALYAVPDKKKKNTAPDPNALYAMPDKKKGVANSGFDASPEKKKGGKPKGKKPKAKAPAPDADVYENAPELAIQNKKKGKDASKDEGVYEDTTAPPLMPKPKPKKNKDGLVYVDLAFNKTSNGKDTKIHGLENATTYMEVDFSKKAKPLPDSDEE